jgi:O-antigen ligase
MAPWVGLLPPLLAALYAGWCGNLLGGATASGSSVAVAVLLAMLAFAGPRLDLLRLGRWGSVWPVALCCAVAASAWLSPVPRAGLGAVVLLPAYLVLPGTLARFWAAAPARRLGARGLAVAVAGLAAWSLAAPAERAGAAGAPAASSAASAAASNGGAASAFATARAALSPLGHHTLLGVWIAALLPLALLACRERTRWRWLGLAAGLAGSCAVVAGRSLAGGAALAAEALLAAVLLARRGRGAADKGKPAGRRLAAGLVLLAIVLAVAQAPRLLRVAGWNDPSARARWVYLRAGWEGWRERPWLGWGPGSVPWTAAWFLAPRPGLNPWGEAVGELHSLPVHLAYETGCLGLACALGVALAFALRRWGERRAAADPIWLAAGSLGLAGAGVAWLATAALAVPALPWAMAIAAAAALAGGCTPDASAQEADAAAAPAATMVPRPSAWTAFQQEDAAAAPAASVAPRPSAWTVSGQADGAAAPGATARPPRWQRAAGGAASLAGLNPVLWVYGMVAAVALLAPQTARWHYDRAVAAGQGGRPREATAELMAAILLDPSFPLYRMRLALLEGSGGGAAAPGGRSPAAPGATAAPAIPTSSAAPAGSAAPASAAARTTPARPAAPGAPANGSLLALQAARDARGVGLLWLAAGVLGQASGEMWSAAALEQACVQDPLGPYPPFYLMVLRPDGPAARRLGARALLAEPRLAAATFWEGRESLFRNVLEEVRRWPGVEAGWKLALLRAAPPPAARRGAVRRLGLAIDAAGFTQSSSLHLFRRLPWPALWPLVAVREELLAAFGMPPATALPGTLATQFEAGHCDPGN